MFHTSVAGLSAAGDVSSHVPSVANAVAAGSSAAAMIVDDLISEAHGPRGVMKRVPLSVS
jgi:thioredoxin reductase